MLVNVILTLYTSLMLLLSPVTDPIKQVMRKHPNGKPYVVIYFDNATHEMVKEEVFFANGNLQWTGTYKNEMENGVWKYYYENGKLKSEQNYTNGKEDGICTDYDANGKKIKESHYSKGKLIKEIKF
ncbi:MAG: toxin-antitoxin system YwqK family antitoxin [Flavobacteriales bacterium]